MSMPPYILDWKTLKAPIKNDFIPYNSGTKNSSGIPRPTGQNSKIPTFLIWALAFINSLTSKYAIKTKIKPYIFKNMDILPIPSAYRNRENKKAPIKMVKMNIIPSLSLIPFKKMGHFL